jgi:hypothetical protein
MSKTIKNLAFVAALVFAGGIAANPATAHDNNRAHYGKSAGVASVVYHYRDGRHTYPSRRHWRRMIRLVRAGRMACFRHIRRHRGHDHYGYGRRHHRHGYGPRYYRVRLSPHKLRRLVKAGYGASIHCRPAY